MRGTTIGLVGRVVSRYHRSLIENGRTNLDRVTVLLTCLGLCKANSSDRGMAMFRVFYQSEIWQTE